jgi:hypothetical protein
MNCDEIVEKLSGEFGLPPGNIRMSLVKTRALKGIDINDADYTLKQARICDFLEMIAGTVPKALYQMSVFDGEKKRSLLIFSYSYTASGKEITKVSAISEKYSRSLEGRLSDQHPQHVRDGYDENQGYEVDAAEGD